MIQVPTLLLIDIQPEYYTKYIKQIFPRFIENITKLLVFARKNKFRIIHIRVKHDLTKNKTVSKKKPHSFSNWQELYLKMNKNCPTIISGNPLPCAQELHNEPVIIKPAFDAFMGTQLHTMIQASKNKKQVIWIAGLMTSICIHHTAHGALIRGYNVHVVVDCCVDRTRAQHNKVISLYKNRMWHAIKLSQLNKYSVKSKFKYKSKYIRHNVNTKKKTSYSE